MSLPIVAVAFVATCHDEFAAEQPFDVGRSEWGIRIKIKIRIRIKRGRLQRTDEAGKNFSQIRLGHHCVEGKVGAGWRGEIETGAALDLPFIEGASEINQCYRSADPVDLARELLQRKAGPLKFSS